MHQSKPIAQLPPREMTAINQLRASAEQVANDAALADRRDSIGEPSRAKRPRMDTHDMNAAQEALQGASRSTETPRMATREEIVATR